MTTCAWTSCWLACMHRGIGMYAIKKNRFAEGFGITTASRGWVNHPKEYRGLVVALGNPHLNNLLPLSDIPVRKVHFWLMRTFSKALLGVADRGCPLCVKPLRVCRRGGNIPHHRKEAWFSLVEPKFRSGKGNFRMCFCHSERSL